MSAFKNPLLAARSDNMYQLIKDLRTMDGVADCYAFGEFAHVKMNKDGTGIQASEEAVRHFLQEKQHHNIEVKPAAATVEDCFIELMKN